MQIGPPHEDGGQDREGAGDGDERDAGHGLLGARRAVELGPQVRREDPCEPDDRHRDQLDEHGVDQDLEEPGRVEDRVDEHGRRHQQRPREVRGGVVEHARRIGHANAAFRARRDIDVVVADRDVGDDLEVRTPREDRLVEPVHHGGQRPARARKPRRELFGGPRQVLLVVDDLVAGAEALDKFAKDSSCNNHPHLSDVCWGSRTQGRGTW